MPGATDVHVDQVLTNYAVEYKNAAYIANQVCPIVPVKKKSDKYTKYNKKDSFSRPKTIRGPKAEANQMDWGKTEEPYRCVDFALKDLVTDETVDNADKPIEPKRRTTRILTNAIQLDREIRVAGMMFNASNYATANKVTLAVADRFNNSSSDPIGVIDTAKEALVSPANIIVVGPEVFKALKNHAAILDRIKGGATVDKAALVTERLLAEVFEVDRFVVGKAKYNTANAAKSVSLSYIWGKFVYVGFQDQEISLEDPSHCKTFQWKPKGGKEGYRVRRWRDEAAGGGGEWIEVDTGFAEKITASDQGYLVSTAVT